MSQPAKPRITPWRAFAFVVIAFAAATLAMWIGFHYDHTGSINPLRGDDYRVCLPSGFHLYDVFADPPAPGTPNGDRTPITLKALLRREGAICRDGELYHRDGRRLFLYRHPNYGMTPGKDREERERRYYEELKSKGAVLDLLPLKPAV